MSYNFEWREQLIQSRALMDGPVGISDDPLEHVDDKSYTIL